MQLSTASLLAVFATLNLASAATFEKRVDVPGLKCSGTDALKCAAELSPAVISCISAAVSLGRNPLSDAKCFASAGNDIANLPDACMNCF